MTVDQLAEAAEVSDSTIRRKLKPLVKTGKVHMIEITVEGYTGKKMPAKAYRWVEEED